MNKLTKTFILTVTLTTISLFGSESARVEVGSRQTSKADKVLFMDRQEQENTNNNDENSEESQLNVVFNSDSSKNLTNNLSMNMKTKGIFNYDPVVFLPEDGHFLISASTQRKAVTIEDGSVWKVKNSDLYRLLNWQPNDFMFITQNKSWFSSYSYRLINHTTKESVEAFLYEGPVINGEFTNFVFAMDLDVGEIVFDDNTVWDLCEADYSTYRNWAINDTIIIGINTGWRSEYTHILINVNTDNWVRARLY